MSTTKENCVLKWTLKAFAFELFIGTRSLISLKSPLIHFSVSLWPVCCCARVRECVCVCVLRMCFHAWPQDICWLLPRRNSHLWNPELNEDKHLYKCVNPVHVCSFCTILYILWHFNNKTGYENHIHYPRLSLTVIHLSDVTINQDGQQGADGCTVKDKWLTASAPSKKFH